MSMKKQQIMGVDFINEKMGTFTHNMVERIKRQQKTFVITANPEILMYAEKDPEYEQIIHLADYVIPDGIGIILAGKLLGKPLVERLAGFDFMVRLLQEANNKGFTVYFLGAREEILIKAMANLKKRYPSLNIVGSHHGFFGKKDQPIIEEIKQLKPDIVLLGLGFPRQEKWIFEHISLFEKGLFIGLGGSFDILSGEVKRAPQIYQRLGLEWFHRLITQPSRWRRMLALPHFMGQVVRLRFKNDIKN